eukprot:720304-Rhodomonas_salina.2
MVAQCVSNTPKLSLVASETCCTACSTAVRYGQKRHIVYVAEILVWQTTVSSVGHAQTTSACRHPPKIVCTALLRLGAIVRWILGMYVKLAGCRTRLGGFSLLLVPCLALDSPRPCRSCSHVHVPGCCLPLRVCRCCEQRPAVIPLHPPFLRPGGALGGAPQAGLVVGVSESMLGKRTSYLLRKEFRLCGRLPALVSEVGLRVVFLNGDNTTDQAAVSFKAWPRLGGRTGDECHRRLRFTLTLC